MDPRRCQARSKQSGEQCKRYAIAGGTVCTMHGGKSPAVRAAAEERLLVAAADRVVADLWVGLDQATPVKDPVASLERLAGALEQLVDETGRQVSTMKNLAGGGHLTQLRAEVTLFDRALDRLSRVLVDMARLGIAEKHIELEQQRAQIIIAAFLAALDLGGLVPEVRTAMVDRFLAGLGELVPGEVVEP
jgi:hypothetical protein